MADDSSNLSDGMEPTQSPTGAAGEQPEEPEQPVAPEWDQGAGADATGDPEPAAAEPERSDPYAADTDTPPDPHEGAVPPGYDWPTHGGYLGCLLGLVAACTLSGFLGGTWFAILATPSWVKLTITLVIALAAFIGLGRLGWVLGKRYYREYPQPARGHIAAPLADGVAREEHSQEA